MSASDDPTHSAMTPHVIDELWCTHEPDQALDKINTALRPEGVERGAVIWFPQGTNGFLALWTVVHQERSTTYIEQRCYGRNPFPGQFQRDQGFRFPNYEYHWSLRVSGQFGGSFLNELSRRGILNPSLQLIGKAAYLGGHTTRVFASDRHFGNCNVSISAGDVFRGGLQGSEILRFVQGWCSRSKEEFSRAAFWYNRVGWFLDVLRNTMWGL